MTRRTGSAIRSVLAWTGALTLLGAMVAGAGLLFAGTWLTKDDVPVRADAMVVLGGGYYRPLYAADLFREGFAPVVYVGRVIRSDEDRMVMRYGFALAEQDAVYRRILTAHGVPDEAVRTYGQELRSTVEEAETLSALLGPGPGRLIVVTSPYHVMRARMTFRHALPGWEVLVCGTAHEPFPERWWTSQAAARSVILETAKLVYYLLGGAFRAPEGGATATAP